MRFCISFLEMPSTTVGSFMVLRLAWFRGHFDEGGHTVVRGRLPADPALKVVVMLPRRVPLLRTLLVFAKHRHRNRQPPCHLLIQSPQLPALQISPPKSQGPLVSLCRIRAARLKRWVPIAQLLPMSGEMIALVPSQPWYVQWLPRLCPSGKTMVYVLKPCQKLYEKIFPSLPSPNLHDRALLHSTAAMAAPRVSTSSPIWVSVIISGGDMARVSAVWRRIRPRSKHAG